MTKPAPIGYRRCFAGLRIFGKIPDFNLITKHLEVAPSHLHRKGQRRTPTSRPYPHDGWLLTARVSRNLPLETHVRWLHRCLVKKTVYLKKMRRKYDVDLHCSYHSNYDQGNLEFPPEVLKWCGDVGIPIRVSILVQE